MAVATVVSGYWPVRWWLEFIQWFTNDIFWHILHKKIQLEVTQGLFVIEEEVSLSIRLLLTRKRAEKKPFRVFVREQEKKAL